MSLYFGNNKIGQINVGCTLSASSGENITHADIPDYVKDKALDVANKVKAVQTDESITFIAMSDAHQLDTNTDIVTGNLHAGMAAKVLAYILPNIDFACFLGDYTAGSSTTTIDEGKQHFAEINADIDEAFSGIPQFRTVGNHDSLQYSKTQNGTTLTSAELFGFIGKYNEGATYGSTTDGYCYRDFTDKKVRVICLNTADNGQKENLSDTQKLWFANTLKSAGAKGAEWGIIVLSHHPLDWGNVLMASNIVHAYVEGASITVSSGNTVNFSGSNNAKFLGAFHGHVHGFKAAKMNYISNSVGTEYQAYRVATPNMCFARNNEYGQNGKTEYYGIEFGEDTTYNKTAGTANDTAFVVNVINPSQQKIYSFCYGAGYDREIFTGIQTVAVTGIALDQTSGTLMEGESVTLTATVQPKNASNKTVTWTSSAPTVATVANGVVTAVKTGTATITAKTEDGNFTATYSLTVEAVPVNYTNLVPTSQEVSSTNPYNGVGYCNGKYLTSSGSPWEGSDSATVLTGNIPYTIPTTGLPKTIYIKGATWETISHCRLYFFTSAKDKIVGPYIIGNGSGNNALTKYYTVETLGDKYIKLTPIPSTSGANSKLVETVANSTGAAFVRFSLVGTGENLIITLDEPIEQTTKVAYTVTNSLNNVTSSNNAGSVEAGSSYNATISPSSGYVIDTVTVTMGSTDITSTAYSDGVISIANVTGNIVITANAVKVQVIDLLTTNGYADNTRLSTASGAEKAEAGYVTIGHTAPIPIGKDAWPNGAIIRVTGADDVVGNSRPYTNSAWCMYSDGGSTFTTSSYITDGKSVVGTFTIDSDRHGFVLDIATLNAPRYLKFSVMGAGANLTATLTPK